MFATRIRTSALAFAGAALLATSLLAPFTAAAAPITPSAESLAGVPPIKLARADIRVERLGGSGTTSHMVYHFRVHNDGPDDMKFHVSTRATFHAPNETHMQSQDFNGDFTLKNGASTDLAVTCNVPGQFCYSGSLHVDKVFGIDPDMGNNLKAMNVGQ